MADEITHLDDHALTEIEAEAEAGQHMRAWRIVGQLVREVRRLQALNPEAIRRIARDGMQERYSSVMESDAAEEIARLFGIPFEEAFDLMTSE